MPEEQFSGLSVSISPDGIIEAALVGDISGEHQDKLKNWAENMKKAMEELSKKDGGRVLTLIDISKLGSFDEHSFEILKDLMVWDKKYATKTATFGGSALITMAEQTLSIVSGRKNLMAFKTKEEAIAWLRS